MAYYEKKSWANRISGPQIQNIEHRENQQWPAAPETQRRASSDDMKQEVGFGHWEIIPSQSYEDNL